MKKRWLFFLLPNILLILISLFTGSVLISPLKILSSLLNLNEDPAIIHILINFRLPRTITALLAGAGLSVSGLYMQTLFQNPLAGPSLLGVSSGASLGESLSVLLIPLISAVPTGNRFPIFAEAGLTLSAVIGSFLVLLALLLLIRSGRFSTFTLLIFGLLLGYITSALVSILLKFSSASQIKNYLNWTFGNFATTGWSELSIMSPVLILTTSLALIPGRELNLLLLGEDYARSMGLNYKSFYRLCIIITALLTGTVTAFCGPVGFIGIAVPHLCRFLLDDDDHRVLLPNVVLCGSAITLLADIVSRLPGLESTLPLNAVTVLISAPVIIIVLLRKRGRIQ